MRAFPLLAALAFAAPAFAAEIEDTRIVPTDEITSRVIVRDLQSTPDRVTGVVVNATPQPIRDVRLLVRDDWLWRNERHPGADNPGRAEAVTVAEDIPPGGRVRFTYRRDMPLPARDDGHFDTRVDVLGFVTLEERSASTP